MAHVTTGRRATPDPAAAFLRAVGRRLDALGGRDDLSAAEAAELRRLRVIWAHAQPTPALRPGRPTRPPRA